MPAGSASYFLFVAAVFFIYWAAPQSRFVRLGIILAANYFFCGRYGWLYVALLPACAAVDYFIASVPVSVVVNLGVLIASRHAGPLWTLGLSFYSLQALTYTIDLRRGDIDRAPNFLTYLTSVSFFPTLQAGPITRVDELVKQFAKRVPLSAVEGGRAFFLIGIGLLKKVLIADFLADNLVNRVFDTPNLYSGAEALLAVYGYSLQLYYDFSGYSDIARGVAQLLGIRLPVNFDRPYLSTNLTEFWRRWHISFSNWLRDYLYFSLPGQRTKYMPYLGLVITMVLGGLWHGITWNFAIWGLLHGAALAVVRLWWAWRGKPRQLPGWRRALGIVGTYHFVCFTWIFFRASTPAAAFDLLTRIGSLSAGFENVTTLFTLVLTVGFLAMWLRYESLRDRFAASPFYVHAAILVLIAMAIQRWGATATAPFVYSRF
jgi:D-alanyl-lipoteichoic acid acyltransferase DltB (MBOAT superfamily)